MESKEKINIFSRYRFIIFVFLISVIAYFAMGKFFFNTISNNVSIYDRASNSYHKNIVFSSSPSTLNSYVNFNGSFYVFNNQKRLLADIYMLSSDSEYTDNYISNKINIENGECAVSSNLLNKNLKKGAKLYISKLEKECTIKYVLAGQNGLDPTYNYNGVIIMGYDESALQYEHSYVYITNEVDYIVNATGYKYLSDEQKKAEKIIIKNCLYIMLSNFILIALLESLIRRKRSNDYRINKREGMKTSKLSLIIFANLVIQYLIPFIVFFIVYCLKFGLYRGYTLFPLILILIINLIAIFLIGVEYIRRSCRWKAKKL